jgi:pSer/pThr/pTyr-binding forkhead associated (FHA) protein
MDVKLVVIEGRPRGMEIPLPSTVFVIGRDRKCHLRPHCELVSQMHCAIARQGGRVVVRDLQSANGTVVNEKPISGQVTVKDGDTLRVGTLGFSFRISVNPNDPTPVQVVDEGDVDWLINSPNDSSVLDAGRTTRLPHIPLETGAEVQTKGSRTVSAGEYLKEYLKRPKP